MNSEQSPLSIDHETELLMLVHGIPRRQRDSSVSTFGSPTSRNRKDLLITSGDTSTEGRRGGDPVCMYPRRMCENCGEYVYATTPRHSESGFWYLECACRAVHPEDAEPEVWSSAY